MDKRTPEKYLSGVSLRAIVIALLIIPLNNYWIYTTEIVRYAGLPSVGPMNFHLLPTETDPMDIIRRIPNGFYVTETMGHGTSITTGDFSVGAQGIWIRDGEFAFPVQEVTIAGNMLDMMKGIEEIASDIRFVSSVISPTFKIAEMTISGK